MAYSATRLALPALLGPPRQQPAVPLPQVAVALLSWGQPSLEPLWPRPQRLSPPVVGRDGWGFGALWESDKTRRYGFCPAVSGRLPATPPGVADTPECRRQRARPYRRLSTHGNRGPSTGHPRSRSIPWRSRTWVRASGRRGARY